MNIFRFCGDMLHLVSIALLLWKLRKSRSCVGISCRMQEIYLIVFATRYLDLFWRFVSIYNSIMKVVFISSTAYLVYLMRFKPPISVTYDHKADKFAYLKWLVPPCAVLAVLFTAEYSVGEVMWTFSIFLESVAIIPQLLLLQQLREVENMTSHYVAAMGLYRLFYIANWVMRYYTDNYINWIGWSGGIVQTALYADFFYYYVISKWHGQKLILPFAQEV